MSEISDEAKAIIRDALRYRAIRTDDTVPESESSGLYCYDKPKNHESAVLLTKSALDKEADNIVEALRISL